MPRFRRGNGRGHGVVIRNFPQHDHVRALAQSGMQRPGKGAGIRAHLPLADDAASVGMQVFDGIFDGDDVAVPGAVDPVYHAGQGGGFAAACRAGDQHDARFQVAKFHHFFRNADLFWIRHAVTHHPQHRRQRTPLAEGVAAEPAHVLN